MPTSGPVISHWYTLLDDFRTSPLDFYKAIEAGLAGREVPDIRFERVVWKEGGALSADRVYLRVIRGRHTFDICAAPFGKSFFFSWWLTESVARFGLGFAVACVVMVALFIWFMCGVFGIVTGLILSAIFGPVALYSVGYAVHLRIIDGEEMVLATPILGSIYDSYFHPNTYFRHDSALMFQESVRKVVMEVINSLCGEQGLRALSTDETLPRLKQLAA